jgi:hypothetical protein
VILVLNTLWGIAMTDKPGEVNKGTERRPSSPANHSWLTSQYREGDKRKASEEAEISEGSEESEKRKIIKLKRHDEESEENKRKYKIWSGFNADTTEIGNIIHQNPFAVKRADLKKANNLLNSFCEHLPLSKASVDQLAEFKRQSEQLRDYFRKQYPVLASQASERTEDSALHPSYETLSREESRSPGPREVIAVKVEEEEIFGFNMGLSSRKREGSALPEEHESKRSKLDDEREGHIRQLDAAREERLRALEERDKSPSLHSSDLVSDYSDDMFVDEVPIEINPIDSSKDEGGPGPTTQAYRQEVRGREAKKQEEEMKEKEILNTRFELELKRVSDYTNKFSLYRQRDESIWDKAMEDLGMSRRNYDKIMQNVEEIKKTAKTEYFEINKEALEASVEELIDNSRILQLLDRLCADRYSSVEKTKKDGKKREEHIGRLEHMHKERLEAQADRRRGSLGPHSLGSDRSSGEDNPILRELKTAKRYIDNFRDYVDNNAGVLMDAVKGVGMKIRDYGEAINDTRTIIAFDLQRISPDTLKTLCANNDKFKQIEEEYQRKISSDRPDRSSDGDNPLQREIGRINRHIDNFTNYARLNNGEVLDAALEAVGMNRETFREFTDNIKQISRSDIEILRATNMQFNEIEKAVKSASGGDDPLQHEIKILNRHIGNFRDYDRNNRKVLDAALKAVGMDRKTFNETIDNITDPNSKQNLKGDIDILLAINMQFDEIEEKYQREILNDFGSEHSDGSDRSLDEDDLFLRELETAERHMINFRDYARKNGKILIETMKAVGMNTEIYQETIDRITNIIKSDLQQISAEDFDTLLEANTGLKQIEEEYQRKISSDRPDRSSDGDNPLQREIDRISRHISNFKNYARDYKEILNLALETENLDSKKLNKIFDSTKNIINYNSQQNSREDINKLRTINMRLDEIEKVVKFMLGQ